MTENTPQKPTKSRTNAHEQMGRGPLLALLGVLMSTEALLVTAGAIYFLSRIFLETPENLSGAIVIFAITFAIAIGLVFTAIAIFRAKTWTRGAIVTWQIMQFAIATSFVQGIAEWQPVGWFLIVLSFSTGFFVVKEMVKSRE